MQCRFKLPVRYQESVCVRENLFTVDCIKTGCGQLQVPSSWMCLQRLTFEFLLVLLYDSITTSITRTHRFSELLLNMIELLPYDRT